MTQLDDLDEPGIAAERIEREIVIDTAEVGILALNQLAEQVQGTGCQLLGLCRIAAAHGPRQEGERTSGGVAELDIAAGPPQYGLQRSRLACRS